MIARITHRDSSGSEDELAPVTDADFVDPSLEVDRRGLWLLDRSDLINVICIPPLAPGVDVAPTTWTAAIRYAKQRRAFVIVDPPAAWQNAADAAVQVDGFTGHDSHAALYFPRILAPDALAENQPRSFAPCGTVAGLYARTDAQRGVWKAPVGLSAALNGVTGLTYSLTDADSDLLNPLAINTLRTFTTHGHVAWGARTLAGNDALQSEYKYIPVRRTALFIEESLHRGLDWVAFELNDERLWSNIRLNVGAFLLSLWRHGAFQGATPREAFFVQCDTTTTTQADIANGITNLFVGFAPLKPAEFLILRILLRTAAAPR